MKVCLCTVQVESSACGKEPRPAAPDILGIALKFRHDWGLELTGARTYDAIPHEPCCFTRLATDEAGTLASTLSCNRRVSYHCVTKKLNFACHAASHGPPAITPSSFSAGQFPASSCVNHPMVQDLAKARH